MNKYFDLLPYVIGGYEVIVRGLPTKKNYSLFHGILTVLKFASGFLNNKKTEVGTGLKIVILIICTMVLFSCNVFKQAKNYSCDSKKEITITFIDANGNYNTTKFQYCDTVSFKKPVDSSEAVKFYPVKN